MKYNYSLQNTAQRSLSLLWVVFLIACLLGPLHEVQAAHVQPGDYVALSVPQVPGGNIVDLALAPSDPNVLYAMAQEEGDYVLYRSLDGGQSWQKRHISSGWMEHLSLLAVDPGNSSVIYAYGNSQGYYERSMDGGATWEVGEHLGELFGAPTSDRLYVVSGWPWCDGYEGKNYSLYRTDDSGKTWLSSDLGCLYGVTNIAVLNSQPDLIYLTIIKLNDPGNFLLKSTDGGQTWQEFALSMDPYSTFLIDPDNPNRLYMACSGGIYASLDGGASWQLISLPTMGTYPNYRLALAGGRLYAAQNTSDRTPLYHSDDGGKTWWASVNLLPAGAGKLQADPVHPERVWAGLVNYGIYFSGDGGASWSEQNNGISSTPIINLLAASASDSNVVYAAVGAPYAAIYRSNDGGQTWGARMPGFEGAGLTPMQGMRAVSPIMQYSSSLSNAPALVIHKLLAHPKKPDIAWAATNAGVYETLDGQRWDLATLPLDTSDLAVSAADPDYVIGVMHDTQDHTYLTYRWCYPSELKCRWSYVQTQPYQPAFNVINLDPLVPHRLLTDGVVYKSGSKVIGFYYQSLDYSSTWEFLGELNIDGKVSGLVVAPQNSRFMLATVENFPGNTHWLFSSQDGGATWVDWSAGLPELFGRSYSLVIDDLGTAYAGTYNGVFRRRPNDDAWEPYWLDQLLMRSIYSLAYVPGSAPKLLASTEYVLWKLDLPPIRRIWLPLVRGSAP